MNATHTTRSYATSLAHSSRNRNRACCVRMLYESHRDALKRATNTETGFTASRSAPGLMPVATASALSGMRMSRMSAASPSGSSSHGVSPSGMNAMMAAAAAGAAAGTADGGAGSRPGSADQVRCSRDEPMDEASWYVLEGKVVRGFVRMLALASALTGDGIYP